MGTNGAAPGPGQQVTDAAWKWIYKSPLRLYWVLAMVWNLLLVGLFLFLILIVTAPGMGIGEIFTQLVSTVIVTPFIALTLALYVTALRGPFAGFIGRWQRGMFDGSGCGCLGLGVKVFLWLWLFAYFYYFYGWIPEKVLNRYFNLHLHVGTPEIEVKTEATNHIETFSTRIFGPDIEQMVRQGDVNSLEKLLANEKPVLRIRAFKALKRVSNHQAKTVLERMLEKQIRYGTYEEQAEATILISGMTPGFVLNTASADDESREELRNPGPRLELEPFHDALADVVLQRRRGGNSWFALMSLVELGDRREELLELIVEVCHAMIVNLESQIDGPGNSAILAWAFGKEMQQWTCRALSQFIGFPQANHALMKALDGELLSTARISVEQKYVLFALAALGDPSIYDRLQYLTDRGHAPGELLDYFGRYSFDEIKAAVDVES